MKNYIQPGATITAVAPAGGIASGAGMLYGGLFGIAATTAAAGTEVEIDTTGVFDLPKLSTAVIAAGGKVSWDAVNSRCDVPGSGLYPIGVAIAAAGNGVATVRVRLDGISTAAAA